MATRGKVATSACPLSKRLVLRVASNLADSGSQEVILDTNTVLASFTAGDIFIESGLLILQRHLCKLTWPILPIILVSGVLGLL